jgi:vacuolar-type H+-ATPase subunit I/STV1
VDTLAIVIAILLVLAGIILLQITLSKSSNKWLGLIIPLICFLCSLIVIFLFIMNAAVSFNGSVNEKGIVTEYTKGNTSSLSNGMFAVTMIIIFIFITNIPTLLFLAIYFYCRNKLKKNKELEKMNIQDLE